MSKVLMIIAQSGFRDEELLVPKEVLERSGHQVKVASITRGKASGMKGAVVTPDMAVYEANPDFFDAFVVVGGVGAPTLADSEDVKKLLIGASGKGKLIGAICLGPMALAKAGVLAGKKATVFPDRGAISLLRETASQYVAEAVVTDGRIITADGPASAGKFGAALAAALGKK